MAEGAREFFEGVQATLDASRTRGTTASFRFDVGGAGSWHVDVADGDVTVAESEAEADCVIEASEENFMKLVRGEGNPTTMYLTGKLKVKGDMGLALKLQQLFF